MMRWLRRIADAVSHADTGPFSGAPRNPDLRVADEKTYSTVRYATHHVAYTTTSTSEGDCSRCGRPLIEAHEIEYVQGEGTHVAVGSVRTCRACQADSWLQQSRMPSASRAQKAARKHVV